MGVSGAETKSSIPNLTAYVCFILNTEGLEQGKIQAAL